jgi:DNA-binding NtrC family response regulator
MLRPETVLVIHESERPVKAIRDVVGAGGAVLQHARSLVEGMHLLAELDPDLAFVSLELAEMEGPRVVRHLRERHPSTKVVALTAADDTGAAVASMRAGAEDYLTLPLDRDRLEQAVGRSLRDIRAARALQTTKEQMRDRYGFRDLLSRSPKMLRVFEQIRAVAPTDATVLILGETGTGKELVAHAIHDGSKRSEKAYISVNCGAFSESLLESELFGHERGSFTGAVERREGVFMMADNGTLFLDELGTTSLSLQVKLLRVLEEMQFRRLGGEKLVSVDVRIVAATNLDLEEAVAAGHFRDDLFYRLNVFPIVLPPLRERAEDIPLLLTHFVESIAADYALAPPVIAADALACIERYAWPGNVRQLRAMCERWVILAHGRTLLKEMLPVEMQGAGAVEAVAPAAWRVDEAEPLAGVLGRVQEQVERAYLHKVLLRYGGHLQRTAAHIGFTRRTLYSKMKQYGMDAAEYRGRDEDS